MRNRQLKSNVTCDSHCNLNRGVSGYRDSAFQMASNVVHVVIFVVSWNVAVGQIHAQNVIPVPADTREVSLVSGTDRNFWSFRLLQPHAIPNVQHRTSTTDPVDAFLLSRLESRGIGYSPAAERETLIRRLNLDLIGLPPKISEINDFLTETSPDVWERLIDRLLANPHFGERWGRHWLDVAGYVDTVGFDTDATNIIISDGKWRYRDFTIDAFNRDLPYDQFITMQLAGDELVDWRNAKTYSHDILENLIATGFLRNSRDMTHEEVGVIPQNFHGIVHDTLEIIGTGLLGLTLNCARCHSHKFDPIPQEDYYRLAASFTPAYNPQAWLPVIAYEPKIRDRGLPDVSFSDQVAIEEHNRNLDARLESLRQPLHALRKPYELKLFDERLVKIPEVIRSDVRDAINVAVDQRSEVQKYLAKKFGSMLTVKPEEVTSALSPEDRTSAAAMEAEIAKANGERKSWGKIQALYDTGPLPKTFLLQRGDENSPGHEVSAGYLRVLCSTEDGASAVEKPRNDANSGRRTELAKWLTEPNTQASSLLARVMVNRIWQHTFGCGLVATTDNFGAQGQPPTHPELLEYLCREYVGVQWRLKPLLRRMLGSQAYRQTSRLDVPRNGFPADPRTVDPANELLWRMPLRRLESETVRDCLLSVSDRLTCSRGGPPVLTDAKPDGSVVVNVKRLTHPDDQWRRSIYLLSRRAYNLSLLTVFDQPQVATNCLARDASAVPLQSLTMLNDSFLLERSTDFANRVALSSSDIGSRIEMSFRMALGRRPNEREISWSRELIEQQLVLFLSEGIEESAASQKTLAQLCHSLFNTSEFLYVE